MKLNDYKELDDEEDNDAIHELACNLIIYGVIGLALFFLSVFIRG